MLEAGRRRARQYRSGEKRGADARLVKLALQPESSAIEASILGKQVTTNSAHPGNISHSTRSRVLAAAKLAGADLALSALGACTILRPLPARGTRIAL